MIFNSFEFLLFLPTVWIVFWGLNRNLRLQNLWLVVASYVFYGWWDWRFLTLIAFTSAWSYVVGIFELRRWEGRPSRILKTTPLHPIFRTKVPKAQFDNFREIMEWISGSCDVVWLNYLTMPFSDEEWRDANHLNLHGAVRFTDRVRADVERLAAGKGAR